MLKKTILGIVAFALVFGLGMLAGMKLKAKSSLPAGQQNNFQAGYDAAKKRLQEKGIGAIPASMETKTLSGAVDKVSGNTLVLKNVSNADPLADPSLDTRTVTVAKDAKIFQLVQKDPTQFQNETEEFQKKIQEQRQQAANADASQPQTAPEPIMPPEPQEKKEISLNDIKEGQQVSVISADNIGDKKEFTAVEVDVQAALNVPSSAPANLPVQAPASN